MSEQTITPRTFEQITDDEIITRQQLCRLWGIGFNTVIRMEDRGELPLIRLSPRRVGYRMGTIRRLMAERELVVGREAAAQEAA